MDKFRMAIRMMLGRAARGIVSAAAALVLFAGGWGWPQGAHAATTGTWTANGSTSATTTLFDLTVTQTGSSGSGGSVYSNAAFETSSTWWNNPYGASVSGATGLFASYTPGTTTLTVRVDFSLPVNNPVLHVNGIGGTTGGTVSTFNSSVWNLTGSASSGGIVAMERLSFNSSLLGAEIFVLNAAGAPGFRRTTGGTAITSGGCAEEREGCGSIRFNGTGITQLTFSVTMRGGAGVGDALKLIWSFADQDVTKPVSGRVFLDNGAGGGTANDGIRNGAEKPLAGVTVRLTNCASTVHATTVTDGTGSYTFKVPTSVASGASLCVEETNPKQHQSTGASVGNTALPSGVATSASGGSYTYTRATDRIAFTWDRKGRTDLNFGEVEASTFAADGARTAMPGNTVTYAHTFTAATTGQVRFSIASTTTTPPVEGWSAQIFSDAGCTGSLQPGATQLFPPAGAAAAVAAGEKRCIVVRQFVPATAPNGSTSKLAVQADFNYANANPSLAASFTVSDVTTVSNVALELKKEVRNINQSSSFSLNNSARPGETLEYRVTYTNNGGGPIKGLTINDVTPAYSSFVSASADTTPASLAGCTKRTPANPVPSPTTGCATAQTAGSTGAIEWRFSGALDPGGTGSVLFRVKID